MRVHREAHVPRLLDQHTEISLQIARGGGVGVVSLVMASPTVPESEATARLAVSGLGATESMVTLVVVDTVFPAASD